MKVRSISWPMNAAISTSIVAMNASVVCRDSGPTALRLPTLGCSFARENTGCTVLRFRVRVRISTSTL